MKTKLGKGDVVRTTKWGRMAELVVDDRRLITVSQDSDIETSLLEEPAINWSAIGAVVIELAEEMKDTLELAIKLATEWHEDTGKSTVSALRTSEAEGFDR